MNRPPFSLVGIDHVVFLVDDMPKALAFYGNVLGCSHGYSYPDLGMEQGTLNWQHILLIFRQITKDTCCC